MAAAPTAWKIPDPVSREYLTPCSGVDTAGPGNSSSRDQAGEGTLGDHLAGAPEDLPGDLAVPFGLEKAALISGAFSGSRALMWTEPWVADRISK
jgi:hypothetical protein